MEPQTCAVASWDVSIGHSSSQCHRGICEAKKKKGKTNRDISSHHHDPQCDPSSGWSKGCDGKKWPDLPPPGVSKTDPWNRSFGEGVHGKTFTRASVGQKRQKWADSATKPFHELDGGKKSNPYEKWLGQADFCIKSSSIFQHSAI